MGRTAVITGGASGIGEATAVRLADAGTTVVTLDMAATADFVLDITCLLYTSRCV